MVLHRAQVCLSPPEDFTLHLSDAASHLSFLVPKPKTRARILLSFYPSQAEGCSAPYTGPSERWGSAHPGDLLSQGHHNEQQQYPRSSVQHRQGHSLATATRTET